MTNGTACARSADVGIGSRSSGSIRLSHMLRAIVTAPSAILRERLRTLAQSADVEISGETGEAARAHALASVSDVLIVWGPPLLSQVADRLDPEGDDQSLSDGGLADGITGATAIVDRDVTAYAVVVVTNDRRVVTTLETLPVRGWAVVLEDATREELRAAIGAADAGMGAMPAEWLARATPRNRAVEWDGDGVADERLTVREQEVLEWLSQGLSNRRIAERLGISEHTVKFHITAIYGKLGASTRTEAVNHALRRGWLRL
jgi:DNA-binding NarL/FixJ family response regulator